MAIRKLNSSLPKFEDVPYSDLYKALLDVIRRSKNEVVFNSTSDYIRVIDSYKNFYNRNFKGCYEDLEQYDHESNGTVQSWFDGHIVLEGSSYKESYKCYLPKVEYGSIPRNSFQDLRYDYCVSGANSKVLGKLLPDELKMRVLETYIENKNNPLVIGTDIFEDFIRYSSKVNRFKQQPLFGSFLTEYEDEDSYPSFRYADKEILFAAPFGFVKKNGFSDPLCISTGDMIDSVQVISLGDKPTLIVRTGHPRDADGFKEGYRDYKVVDLIRGRDVKPFMERLKYEILIRKEMSMSSSRDMGRVNSIKF